MAYGGGFRRGGFRRDFGPREMHKITCSECGEEAEVPFKPSGDRPVYCRDCFLKKKGIRPREPRKSKEETEEVEEAEEEVEEEPEETEEVEKAEEEKKGRGRPRKSEKETVEETEAVEETEEDEE